MNRLLDSGPYPYTQASLEPAVLDGEVRNALSVFENWRDTHADLIAGHVEDMTATLDVTARQNSFRAQLGRIAIPPRERKFNTTLERQYIKYFGIQNLGEDVPPEGVDFLWQRLHDARRFDYRAGNDPLEASFGVVRRLVPEIQETSEINWLEDRVRHLRTILPEDVVRSGGLGKTMRIVMGVLSVGAYDVADQPFAVRREHLQQVTAGAYAWGAAYALVDDTLQARSSKSITPEEKGRYDDVLLASFMSGEAPELADLPDHPVSAELTLVYKSLLNTYPFQEYRHLYHSIEAIYRAQQREMQLTPESVIAAGGLRSMYPDMAIKAGMTRVIANIMGRRTVTADLYTKYLNFMFGIQQKDDFEDHVPDQLGGDYTAFNLPYNPDIDDPGPLYDLFAYDAYVRHVVWGKHLATTEPLLRFTPSDSASYLARHKDHGERILATWPHTEEMARFIVRATDMTERQAHLNLSLDMRLEETMRDSLSTRNQNTLDARTFLADRRAYLDSVVSSAVGKNDNVLKEVAAYTIDAGGKRVRPGMTLMLAQSLGIPPEHIEPLLQMTELLHSTSLIFDDLPAQDNANIRRGKATAHVAFPEWSAQLAGISMLSKAYGVSADLAEHFPATRINEVVRYLDSRISFDGLCLGQALDLDQVSNDPIPLADILNMYQLKTSLALESSLVPLMMLMDRSEEEIGHVKDYAYHAGIVFQIKDDLLDMVGSTDQIGKATQQDAGKANVARNYGTDIAEQLMSEHEAAATMSLAQLPFNTQLLSSVLHYFAKRIK